MQTSDNFIHRYTDRPYRHATLVRHRGTVIAFAMDDKHRIYYSVLNLRDPNAASLDKDNWQKNPELLHFPDEITQVGFAGLDQTRLPIVKKNGDEVTDDSAINDQEIDRFLSSTARLTSDAPFQVISDGKDLYLFRQSVATDHDNAVFKRDSDSVYLLDDQGQRIPLANNSLLLDRFILAGTRLLPKTEVRYQRSRSRYRPQSRKDSLSARDMEDRSFFEPTHELDFINELQDGRFSVLLLPSQIPGQQRWQVFAQNKQTGLIDSFNIERAKDGLFNTQGTRFYTCPNHPEIFEKTPGQCPIDDSQELVPITRKSRQTGSALHFSGKGQLQLPNVNLADSGCIECWLKLEAAAQQTIFDASILTKKNGRIDSRSSKFFYLEYRSGKLRFGMEDSKDADFNVSADLSRNEWHHVAITWRFNNAPAIQMFVDGIVVAEDKRPSMGKPDWSELMIGQPRTAYKAKGKLKGQIDELRLWQTALSAKEVIQQKDYRLQGDETDLLGYWPFEDGQGTSVRDHSANALNGVLSEEVEWITSAAPLKERPGMRSESFSMTGREVSSGLSAALYYQQEMAPTGYQNESKPLRKNARVMLTMPTRSTNAALKDKDYIAVIDFAVTREGRLAQIPTGLKMPIVDRATEMDESHSSLLDAIKNSEERIKFIHNQLHDANQAEAELMIDIQQLETELLVREEKLTLLKAEIKNLEKQREEFADTSKDDSATFFGNVEFVDPLLSSLNIGEYSNEALLKKTDPVKSIKIPASRRVTLYAMDEIGQEVISTAFQGNIAELENSWNSVIKQIDITLRAPQDESIESKREELEQWQRKPEILEEKKQRISDVRNSQKDIPTELEVEKRNLDQLNIAAQRGVPLPLIHIDSEGLTVTGGLLTFAWSESPPQIFESSNGKLSLYFRGEKDQFFTAYYDVLTAKSKYPINEDVMLASRSAAPELDTAIITIEDGSHTDTCHITIGLELLGFSETWKDVPRTADKFAAVLNGSANTEDEKDRYYYDYKNLGFEGKQVSTDVRHSLLFFVITKNDLSEVKNIVSSHALGELATDIEITDSIESIRINPQLQKEYTTGTQIQLGNHTAHLTKNAIAGSDQLDHSPVFLKESETLPAGTPVFIVQSKPSQWIADRPGKAVAFDGKDDYLTLNDHLNFVQILPQGDLSMEAWVKPELTPDSGINPSDNARLINCESDQSNYTLGLSGRPTALKLDGENDHVDLGNILNPADKQLTVELWFRTERSSGQNILFNKESLYEAAINKGYFEYAFQPHWKWQKIFPVKTGVWYHVAVVYDGQSQRVYRNGVRVSKRRQKGSIGSNTKKLLLGARGDKKPKYFFNGQIDEVRIWDTARSETDISKSMRQRLKGDETHLQGYWQFQNRSAQDLSNNQQHGRLVGNPQNTFYLFAGVGDKFVASKTSIEFGHWSHVAATYNQSYALEFSKAKAAYLDCGDNQSLNQVKDLTIEVFLKVMDLSAGCGLLSKGKLDAGTPSEVPYDLIIQADGKLRFSFEDSNHNLHEVISDTAIENNTFYRIAMTRKHETKVTEQGKKVSVDQWDDIRIYVAQFDAEKSSYEIEEAGYLQYRGPGVGSNSSTVGIGRSYAINSSGSYFSGIISEVRLWSTAREINDIALDITGQEKGLISWWRFEENEGNIAFDSKGNNHATRSAAQWIKNPDPIASSLVLYNNGSSIPSQTIPPLSGTGQQFSLGAHVATQQVNETREVDGEATVGEEKVGIILEGFSGVMEEVRIWKTFRTQEQIQDNMFRTLLGEREDLLAYYAFDDEHNGGAKDSSFNQHHLTSGKEKQQPTFVLSKAPVGTDTAQVRSALAGQKTDFHDVIHGRPGVQEYGDMQLNTEGELFGVMKRAYSMIKDDQWQLITGFKVGDLHTEWVGQAQANPQLFGYIEGAPPVPSENLTSPSQSFETYNGVSSVSLNEANNVRYVYTSSEELGLDTVFNIKATAGFKSNSDAGFGLTTSVEETNLTAGVKGYFESSNSRMDDSSVSIGRNTNRISEMELIGTWESPNSVRNDSLGRRFIAQNVGFALVQSDTVDIFALRLKHNNALVSYWMRPNPDIPKDWNILTFEINPAYTEQGTLDGKIGFDESGRVVTSENYPNAASYGEWSYFKPREAYSLKNQIERDDQELKNFYENHNAAQGTGAGEGAKIGAVAGGILGGAAGAGLGALAGSAIGGALSSEASLPDEELKKLAKRNIANTYVWTASGGFFAESTQVMEARSATAGGNFSMKGGGGATVEFNTAISKVAVGFEMDALFGAHWNVTTTKSLETEESFSIDIKLDTERDIQKYIDGQAEYDTNGNPIYQTGKVDAYRFMSFYLQPDLLHFEEFTNKVVDRQWLQESNDPNAIALRQAVQAQQTAKDEDKSLPWRVMHRVTYISRILPDIAAPDAPPLEKAIKKIDLESHYQLVLRLEPLVRDKIGEEFDNAVSKAVRDRLPELIPHIDQITEFMRLYLEVPDKNS